MVYGLTSWLNVKLHRLNHIFRTEDSVEFFLSQDAMFKNEVVYTTACFESFFYPSLFSEESDGVGVAVAVGFGVAVGFEISAINVTKFAYT